jgi:hypothetical protein
MEHLRPSDGSSSSSPTARLRVGAGRMRARDLAARCTVLFGPVWGRVEPRDLAAWILDDKLPVASRSSFTSTCGRPTPGECEPPMRVRLSHDFTLEAAHSLPRLPRGHVPARARPRSGSRCRSGRGRSRERLAHGLRRPRAPVRARAPGARPSSAQRSGRGSTIRRPRISPPGSGRS